MLITQISLAAFQVTIDCCNSRHSLKVSVFSVFTPINCFRCAFVRCCTTFWKSYNRDAHNLRTRHVAVTVSILWFARQLLSVLFTVIPGDCAYAHITSKGADWNTEGVSLNSVCRWSTTSYASSHSYLCSLQVLAFGFRLTAPFPTQTPLLTAPMESVTETPKLDGKKQYRFLLARGRSISKRIW